MYINVAELVRHAAAKHCGKTTTFDASHQRAGHLFPLIVSIIRSHSSQGKPLLTMSSIIASIILLCSPPSQAVHPIVFQLPRFNNRLNSAITQFYSPPKKQTLGWFAFAFTWQRRWLATNSLQSYSLKVKKGFFFLSIYYNGKTNRRSVS